MEIKLMDVSKRFGSRVLYDRLSFTIPSGKMTGIFGKSGAGKTTLLNVIGLIEPYEGTILYDGKEVKKHSDIRRFLADHFGFVFQNYGLVDQLTVKENIELLKCMNKSRKEEMESVLKEVGLEGFEKRKVYELSGGEQQRVAIAKILLKNPDVILADEPTASLDEGNKAMVMNYLRKFADAEKTVVIVSHDPDVMKQCDCIIHLDKELKTVVYDVESE